MKILSKIKSYWIVFEFASTVAIIIILMYLFNRYNRAIRRAWAKLQKFLIGYRVEVEGEIDREANMILINHQSLLDIVVLEEIHPNNLAWVAKKEIAEIKFFGNILRVPKMIIVDRESKKSLVKLFRDVKDRLANNRVIAMFPEGTRGDGKKLLPFKEGAKMLAEKLNLRVQPVVVLRSREVLDSQNFKAKIGIGTIKVIFLDSVDRSNKNWYQKMREDMQKVIDSEYSNNFSDR